MKPMNLAMAGLLLATSGHVSAAQLQGRVTATTGEALSHAQLTLRHDALEKATTAYTDAEGYYRLSNLEAGSYSLRARRLGNNTVFESGLVLSEDDSLKRDIVLKAVPKARWVHELPASDWFARAEFSSEALRGQFSIQCAMCHQQGSSTTRVPRSRENWHELFNQMAEYGAVMDQALYDEAPEVLNATFDFSNLDLSEFPDDPNARYNSDVQITEWEVGHETAFLHDMVLGHDGMVYSVDWINDKLYQLDPATNAQKEWEFPVGELEPGGILGILAERGRRYLHHTPTVAPHSLQAGPDGKLWITLSTGRGLASFDPKTETFATYDHPARVMYPHTLRFDQKGNIWYTVSMTNHLVKFDPQSKQFTVYDLPTRNFTQWILARSMRAVVWISNVLGIKGQAVVGDAEMNPVPYGIDVTPDGKVWFTQFNNRRIGYIDPETEEITMIDTPFSGPRRMRADSKGVLWIPSYNSGAFYRYAPSEGEFIAYQVPTGRGDLVYALAIDPQDDSVWLCGTNSDTMMRFDQQTQTFDTYQLPSRVSFTRELEVDEAGNLWTSTSNMPFYQVEGMRGRVVRLSFPNRGGEQHSAEAH